MGKQPTFLTLLIALHLPRLCRRGYFPRGGGLVEASISPVSTLQPVELLDPGRLISVSGTAFVAGRLPLRVSSAMPLNTEGRDSLKGAESGMFSSTAHGVCQMMRVAFGTYAFSPVFLLLVDVHSFSYFGLGVYQIIISLSLLPRRSVIGGIM